MRSAKGGSTKCRNHAHLTWVKACFQKNSVRYTIRLYDVIVPSDGPPEADYHAIASLLSLGSPPKSSSLHDGGPGGVGMVGQAVNLSKKGGRCLTNHGTRQKAVLG
jgi:hypothetical protein